MGFWSRWLGIPLPDSRDGLIEALKAENAFLRGMLEKTQDQIISMADPLLKQREAALERQRLAPVVPPINNNQRAQHHPQLLARQMEARELAAQAAALRDPVEVERRFRRQE